METLKKRWVAVVITVIVIALAICFGLMKAGSGRGEDLPAQGAGLDTSLDTGYYTRFLYDQADLLSPQAEETILLYDANWDHRYNSVVAVVTLESAGGASLEDAAYDQGAGMGLGEGDAVLLIAAAEDSYYVAPGNDFATILTLVLAYFLTQVGYDSIWPLFGASNQLLSVLAFLACAVFLKRTKRRSFMLWVPLFTMAAVTFSALAITIGKLTRGIADGTYRWVSGMTVTVDGASVLTAWGAGVQLVFAVLILALGVVVVLQGVRKLLEKTPASL